MTNFYLVNVLMFKNDDPSKTPIQVALVPLILYVNSVFFSARIDWMFKVFGRKTTFAIGAISALGTQAALVFLTESLSYIYIL